MADPAPSPDVPGVVVAQHRPVGEKQQQLLFVGQGRSAMAFMTATSLAADAEGVDKHVKLLPN